MKTALLIVFISAIPAFSQADSARINGKFNCLVSNADFLADLDYQKARSLYQEADSLISSDYCKKQADLMRQFMLQDAYHERTITSQYLKIISKSIEYIKSGDFEKAEALLKRCLSLRPDDKFPLMLIQLVQEAKDGKISIVDLSFVADAAISQANLFLAKGKLFLAHKYYGIAKTCVESNTYAESQMKMIDEIYDCNHWD